MSELYIVGTPIGNLEDISKRALSVLSEVDFIIAEDCRVTLKLLNSYKIKKPLFSYNKFSSFKRAEYLVNKVLNGESAALVSDAGMPLICDPGDLIINLCHEKGVVIRVVPGACALIAGLCLSGFSCARFTFFGFLSTNKKNRISALNFLKDLTHTVILYEAPHKLLNTLKDLLRYFNDRQMFIVKEMTKIHETFHKFKISSAILHYEKQNKIKGEFVLIIEGLKKEEESVVSLDEAVSYAKKLVLKGEKKVNAAKKAAIFSNFNKNEIYKHLTE